MQTINIPSRALVLTVGPAGCGKSTFVEWHFPATTIVSSDRCREMVSDSETDQSQNKQAFELFHTWIRLRLAAGRLTVADATNLLPSARTRLREIAAVTNTPVIVLEFEASLDTCLAQNRRRARFVPEHVIQKHVNLATQAHAELGREGYAALHTISTDSPSRVHVWSGVRSAQAPGFDIIGDVHGCADELRELIAALGYRVDTIFLGEGVSYVHPEGRQLVFVGDITDRGPKSLQALRIVQLALEGGHHMVLGNHDSKLMRALRGNKVQMGHGLAATWAELQTASEAERQTIYRWLSALPYQLTLFTGFGISQVVVSHAGLPRRLVGQDTSEARNHAIYGEVIGTVTPGEYPVRGVQYIYDWPLHSGAAIQVHGHTVVDNPQLDAAYGVYDIDTGCAFGGQLTALRWPEGKFVSIPARAMYCER